MCKHYPALIYKAKGVEVYVGAMSEIGEVSPDVVLACNGDSPKAVVSTTGIRDFVLPKRMKAITIDWPDMQGPPSIIDQDFWNYLADWLKKHAPIKLMIYCRAGHGRSGAAACALLHALGFSPKDIVKWLRKRYCEEAVETESQLSYLRTLGISTQAEGSYKYMRSYPIVRHLRPLTPTNMTETNVIDEVVSKSIPIGQACSKCGHTEGHGIYGTCFQTSCLCGFDDDKKRARKYFND